MIGANGTMVIEYLRSRRVLRMVTRGGRTPEVVELPLPAFLEGLGLQAPDLAPTRHYLLFAGVAGAAAGGLRDLLGLYDEEDVARDAFRAVRLSPAYRRGWAELVALRPGRGTEAVCWFGRAPSAPAQRDQR